LLEAGFTPVVSCVVSDGTGGLLNANADHVAGAIAATLRADVLIQMTDVAQLRANPDDPDSAISTVSIAAVDDMIARGDIREGMIPKMQAAAVAVRNGAQCVVMASGVEAGALGRARHRQGLYTEVVA
jgi:acetylglutamate kinase